MSRQRLVTSVQPDPAWYKPEPRKPRARRAPRQRAEPPAPPPPPVPFTEATFYMLAADLPDRRTRCEECGTVMPENYTQWPLLCGSCRRVSRKQELPRKAPRGYASPQS